VESFCFAWKTALPGIAEAAGVGLRADDRRIAGHNLLDLSGVQASLRLC